MQCILPQGQTTPERVLSNPWYDKGFCEPHQYKAAIDRCKGGYDSCDVFINILADRAKIERNYITEIDKWVESSIKEISQTKEFGTNKKAWIEAIRSSKETANTHKNILERLDKNVIDDLTNFKKENYGKSVLHVKKIKEFEQDFEKVQKSWIKLLDRINKTKKEFHDAHRLWKKAETAEKIILSDHGAEDEQKTKAKLSVGSYKKEVEAARSKYEQYLEEMKNARPNYEGSMKQVLDRTHDFERKRLKQFLRTYQLFHEALLMDKDPHIKTLTESFNKAIGSQKIEEDIKWWNEHFGSDTATKWPSFEEPRN